MKIQLTARNKFKSKYAFERENFRKYMRRNCEKVFTTASLDWLYLDGKDPTDPARLAVYLMAKEKYLGNRYQWINTAACRRITDIRCKTLLKGIL